MHSLVDWGWVDDKITAGVKDGEERGFSFFLCFFRAGGRGCG